MHPKVSKEELAYIHSDEDKTAIESDEKLPWRKVVRTREAFACRIPQLTDAVWWFYLFWGAKFLADTFDVNIKNIAIPFFIIYSFYRHSISGKIIIKLSAGILTGADCTKSTLFFIGHGLVTA